MATTGTGAPAIPPVPRINYFPLVATPISPAEDLTYIRILLSRCCEAEILKAPPSPHVAVPHWAKRRLDGWVWSESRPD